jgi:hypothetical protein
MSVTSPVKAEFKSSHPQFIAVIERLCHAWGQSLSIHYCTIGTVHILNQYFAIFDTQTGMPPTYAILQSVVGGEVNVWIEAAHRVCPPDNRLICSGELNGVATIYDNET